MKCTVFFPLAFIVGVWDLAIASWAGLLNGASPTLSAYATRRFVPDGAPMNATTTTAVAAATVATALPGVASLHFREVGVKVVFRRGHVWELSELPPKSIALDGAVRGPAIDTANERYSFDHHDNCVRHATLSTCEQVFDAIRVGLVPRGFTVYVNDWDGDTVLSLWLLCNWAHAWHGAHIVRTVGRLDALGPASGLAVPAGLLKAWSELYARDWRGREDWDQLSCVDSYIRMRFSDLDRDVVEKTAKEIVVSKVEVDIDNPSRGDIYTASEPFGAFGVLYGRGIRFAVLMSVLPDGSYMYTIGKQSEFVPGNIPAILAALREEEIARNPAQLPANNWGGGSTIGGSPRNPDKSGSRLDPATVQFIVDAFR